jgi:phosphatidate cytidylyltransferase
MMRLSGRMPNEKIGLVASIAFPLVALMRSPLYVLVAVMCLVVAVAVWFVAKPRASVADVAVTFFAPIYTSLMYSSIVFVRCVDAGFSGAFLAFGVMGSVWLNDACAYFVGSRFGTRKLAPQISPNKSVEGFVGGLVGGMIAWVILAATGCCGMNFAIALPTGLASGIAAVMGDLFESRIKRGVGVKDSGNLIPGHGGMLDRCDSMLFAAAVASLGLLAGGIL